MDKKAKLILNSLKCPICQSQIDLYDYMRSTSKSTSYNFCCSTNYYHYRLWFPHWDNPPVIHYDVLIVYDGHHQFLIEQRYLIKRTVIDVWEVDDEHHTIDERSKRFSYNQELFDYKNTNLNKIINRIRTVLTFQ